MIYLLPNLLPDIFLILWKTPECDSQLKVVGNRRKEAFDKLKWNMASDGLSTQISEGRHLTLYNNTNIPRSDAYYIF